jgi:hypothetical protein
MQAPVERRSFQRFNVDPLLCNTIPEMRGVCVLRNVSLAGAYFLNHTPPPVGSRVRVEFSELPLDGYRLIGEVVRHGLGAYRGFALNFSIPHPKLLRAVYHAEYPN